MAELHAIALCGGEGGRKEKQGEERGREDQGKGEGKGKGRKARERDAPTSRLIFVLSYP